MERPPSSREGLLRVPTYSDYAIQHPSGVEGFDPRRMQVSPAGAPRGRLAPPPGRHGLGRTSPAWTPPRRPQSSGNISRPTSRA